MQASVEKWMTIPDRVMPLLVDIMSY